MTATNMCSNFSGFRCNTPFNSFEITEECLTMESLKGKTREQDLYDCCHRENEPALE